MGIMAVGHVLVDGIGVAAGGFVERFGAISSPAHINPERMELFCRTLEEDNSLLETPLEWTAGGGIAIMAKAALALGIQSELWASVGRDERGKFLARKMAEAGCKTCFLESASPTGVFCSIAMPGGGKKIIVSPAAAREIRGAEIPDEAFHEGWIFYLDGLLIDSPAWLASLAAKAKTKGMMIAMDLSTPANAKSHAAALLGFAEAFCDVVFANEAEFSALGAAPLKGSREGPLWVVKKGEKGASIYSEEGVEHAKSERVEVVDDTGAGDSFSAGFLLGRMEGLNGKACLKLGNAVAAAALGFRGSNFEGRVLKKAYEDERHAQEIINNI